MINSIKNVIDNIQGKKPWFKKRNKFWQKIRKEHLKNNNKCAACNGDKKLEVHHIKPFHLHPEVELDLNNLITLCESKKNGVNCHLLFGHLGNYKSINPNVINDSTDWNLKLTNRK